MPRWDYDAVFYRVFCITLLAVAFTFTVILTNVFIDIDGLLSSKKDKVNNDIVHEKFTTEAEGLNNDEMNYGDSDDSYRTKRSIETQSFLFHIKNPKVKNILANRLSTLLEELEAEEATEVKPTEKKNNEDISKGVETTKLVEEDKKKDQMLHLRMHNILLEGIEKHMDLNDVYKNMYSLMSNFKELHDGTRTGTNQIGKGEDPKLKKPIEDKFFDEMLNCNDLQDHIVPSTTVKPGPGHPKVVIKTVIDITSTGNEKPKENDTKISNENIQGDIELIYNGKVIKFTHSDTERLRPQRQKKIPVAFNPKVDIETPTVKETNEFNMVPKLYMNKFVEEYFKHFPHDSKESNDEIKRHFETKRLKRHVRIKYENENSVEPKKTNQKNTDEDELYVEIETHFDSKGMKGEKKKKLIKSLIEKIQKAIHSDITGKVTTGKNSTKQRKSIQFRKRIQNPLDHNVNYTFVNKYGLPIANIVHRQLHPISKTVPIQDSNSPSIVSKTGDEWKQPNSGPKFLANTKAINSAELSQVNVDYSKILEINGIPQRLQQPLNTELSEETIKSNSYYDMGKMKFVIKDIDGSGFSVGFNQYVDEPPDKESMQLFSGLENIIKTYHKTYDPDPEPLYTTESNLNSEELPLEFDNNEHVIERRSINKKKDYHSNEYKVIFDNGFLPYKHYRDIYTPKKSKPKTSRRERQPSLIVDENIFDKNLKPSEIFSLANLFKRKKRSLNVQKVNDLKTRLKFNRFLNTNAMSKTIYLNTKRNKRQINKIRIIATDLPRMSKHSDENIYVVSDENVFADRALIKEETDDRERQEEEYLPYQNNDSGAYITKIFDGISRHNSLMSKYPHVFMEEVSRSREEYIPNNSLRFGKLPGLDKTNTELENIEDIDMGQLLNSITNDSVSRKQLKGQEIDNVFEVPPSDRSNYKMSIKIVPKNHSGLNSGFKEVHTSINKSFNKNGLLYSSLLNVSEISKIIKLNRSKEEASTEYLKMGGTNLTKKIHDQQEKMQFLLKQHAKHINEQLNRLQEEKVNLESIFNGDNNTDIDHALNMSLRRLKLANSEEVVSKTATTEEPKATINSKLIDLLTPHTTPPSPVQILRFSEKVKTNNIISTIERNGNLTDQILKKIDKNTEILQLFLKKLMDRIEVPPTDTPKLETVTKDENTSPPDWRYQVLPFTQNMVIRKNDSHISIPFTYAIQPPTSIPIKTKTQVANVIYQGHIRNTVRHNPLMVEKENQIPKFPEAKNQSKFFIDALENEYKVIQMGGFNKNQDYHMVHINNTLL